MDFSFLGIVSVPAITVICYLVGVGVKASPIKEEFIPVIVGVVGAIFGLVAFLTKMPNFPADNFITALAVGIVSGLASTGINQIIKQFKKLSTAEGEE